MRLTNVTAYTLSSPIHPPQDRHFAGGVRRLLKRDFVLVVVETADGEVGVAPGGASSSAIREYFEGASQDDFASVIEEVVAPEVTGDPIEDPAEKHGRVAAGDLPEMLESQAVSVLDVALRHAVGGVVGIISHVDYLPSRRTDS